MSLVEINWKPDRGQLRTFGIAGAVVLGALAGWVLLRQSLLGMSLGPATARTTGGALLTAAGLLAVLAFSAPGALRPVYLLLTALGLPIGFVMSYVILAVVYFGLFTPLALVFRLVGRDALCRKIDPNAATYWTPRRPAKDVKRYFRQF